MSIKTLRRMLAKSFISIGYLSCMLQWVWLSVVGLPPLIQHGHFDWFLQASRERPAQTQIMTAPSPILWAAVGIITIVMLGLMIVVLIRLPRVISNTGEQVVKRATEAVLPVVTHQKKLPHKQEGAVSNRIRLIVQLLIVVLPFGICLLLPAVQELSRQLIVVVAAFFAAISLLSFSLGRLVTPPTSQTRPRVFRVSR